MLRFRFLLLVLALPACLSAQQQQAPPVQTPPSSASATAQKTNDEYEVGIGDVLGIVVLEDPTDFPDGLFPVGADGNITFTLVGHVKVAGLTLRKVQDTISKAIQDHNIFGDATVRATIQTYASHSVQMLGEVVTKGNQLLTSDKMTLTMALRNAGGLTPLAGTDVTVTHTSAAGRATETYQIDKVQSGQTPDPILHDGDSVLVQRAPFVYVNGEVMLKGVHLKWVPHMTVAQAIEQAGGFTPKANKGHVRIRHEGEKKESGYISEKQQATLELKPEDTIRVEVKWFGGGESRGLPPRP